jgi:hypothetical protein
MNKYIQKRLIFILIAAITVAIVLFVSSRHQKPGTAAVITDTTAGQVIHSNPTASPSTSEEQLLKQASSSPGINAGAGNFEIRTPAGWQRSDTSLNGIQATLLLNASSDPGFRTNVNVVSETMHDLSLDNYAGQTIVNMSKYLQGFALVGKGERVIGGIHARWIEYTQRPSGFALANICYIIPYKGIAYIITCSSLQAQLEENRPVFDQAVNSFRLRH